MSAEDYSGLSLCNVKNYIDECVKGLSDKELVEKRFIIKSNNGMIFSWEALQMMEGNIVLTFSTPPIKMIDSNGSCIDYKFEYESVDFHDGLSYEEWFLFNCYGLLTEPTDFLELVHINGRVLGRISVFDSFHVANDNIFIIKDNDVPCNDGFSGYYSVPLRDVYSVNLPKRFMK